MDLATTMPSLLTANPLGVMLAAAGIATLLGHAAAIKLADRALFEQHLSAYGVPHALLPALAWALPVVEALLALMLLAGPTRKAAAVLAAALVLAYGLAMAWHLARGHRLDCGCGGEPMVVSWWLVARNVLLAAAAGLASQATTPRALGLGDALALVAALALTAVLYAALHEVLRTRMRHLDLRRRESLQEPPPRADALNPRNHEQARSNRAWTR